MLFSTPGSTCVLYNVKLAHDLACHFAPCHLAELNLILFWGLLRGFGLESPEICLPLPGIKGVCHSHLAFLLHFFFFLRWLVQTSTSFATGHFVSDFAIVHNLKPTSYLTLLFKGHPQPHITLQRNGKSSRPLRCSRS